MSVQWSWQWTKVPYTLIEPSCVPTPYTTVLPKHFSRHSVCSAWMCVTFLWRMGELPRVAEMLVFLHLTFLSWSLAVGKSICSFSLGGIKQCPCKDLKCAEVEGGRLLYLLAYTRYQLFGTSVYNPHWTRMIGRDLFILGQWFFQPGVWIPPWVSKDL